MLYVTISIVLIMVHIDCVIDIVIRNKGLKYLDYYYKIHKEYHNLQA